MIVRPTTSADVTELTGEAPPFRIRAWSGVAGGRVIGIGGLAYMPDGTIVAFAHLTPEARAQKFALHRAALKLLAEMEAHGVRRLVATADPDFAAAERWLTRLGFRRDPRHEKVWIWICSSSSAVTTR
ncbi:MAG: GNAT family N-acetyltransferase [Gammaproteobacteria bacterium]|nr:GNAT family N-acetyltransferase [Gammaproteobacteria bacterium]